MTTLLPVRRLGALAVAALALLAVLVAPAAPAAATPYLLSAVNSERYNAGLPSLTRAADLDAVAQQWTQQMAASGVLSHNPYLSSQVANWTVIAENVGWGGSESAVHTAFMGSAPHRANILSSQVSEIGIGVVTSGGRTWVTEVFRSPRAPAGPPTAPIGAVDSAAQPAASPGVRVSGWAIDPESADPTSVHVYVDGQWGTALSANVSRPDVAAAHPAYGAAHGFDGVLSLAAGVHQVCVFAINLGAGNVNPLLGCRAVWVGHTAMGNLDVARHQGNGVVRVAGWTIDPDTADSTTVHVYVDGRWGTALTAAGSRPDVASVVRGFGDRHGYDGTVTLTEGVHQVCAFAINLGAGATNPLIGCRTVVVDNRPFGSLDLARGASDGGVQVGGWTIDPDTADATTVHVYVDGRWGAAMTAAQSRPDVSAAYPAFGDRHGYVGRLALTPGPHQVCVFAINVGAGTTNPLIGCRNVS